MEEPKKMDMESLLRRMEDAAREGAKEGAREGAEAIREGAREGAEEGAKHVKVRGRRGGNLLSALIIVILLAIIIVPKINAFLHPFATENSVEGHDLTLSNEGILGYTVADFADAILGDSTQLTKLEVFSVDLSEAATITDTGFLNLKFLTKTMIVTYNGTATYTVDLSELDESDIVLDEEDMTVVLYIPHVDDPEINVPLEDMQIGDINRGSFLALGDMDMSLEDQQKIAVESKDKMVQKLEEENMAEQADMMAKSSVWNIYQPIINGVAKGYTLDVEFVD